MKLEPGKFYRLSDGTKAGPAELCGGQVREWRLGDQFYSDDGECTTGVPGVRDVVAEWVDAPDKRKTA